VAVSQALVPRAPPQGRGMVRSESRPIGDHGVARATSEDDYPPGWGQSRGRPGSAPERARGAGEARGRLRDVAAPGTWR
jgi:hypothetical protein